MFYLIMIAMLADWGLASSRPVVSSPSRWSLSAPAVTVPDEKPAPPKVEPAAVPMVAYLASESWCPNCPPAKARFKAAGNPESRILTMAQAKEYFGIDIPHVPYEFMAPARPEPVRISAPVRQRLPVVQTQWGTIDLETYNRNCNCPMCVGIRLLQQQYRQTALTPDVPAEQQPTPAPAITSMLRLMHLSSSDVLADIGCGDGRILIEAVRQYGCRGVGIEIDPEMADRARAAVTAAGMSGQITILTGDAKNFRPEDHEVTAATVYLYPELLAELEPMLKRIPIVGSPYHQIASLPQTKHGDIWIYRKGTPSRTATTWRSGPPQCSGIIVTSCRRLTSCRRCR